MITNVDDKYTWYFLNMIIYSYICMLEIPEKNGEYNNDNKDNYNDILKSSTQYRSFRPSYWHEEVLAREFRDLPAPLLSSQHLMQLVAALLDQNYRRIRYHRWRNRCRCRQHCHLNIRHRNLRHRRTHPPQQRFPSYFWSHERIPMWNKNKILHSIFLLVNDAPTIKGKKRTCK